MLQITPQLKIWVAIEPADFRRGIDGMVRLCRDTLCADPFCGSAFVFRNRRKTAIKVLVYDGQGFWLHHKRLSSGQFRYWPSSSDTQMSALQAHELHVLLYAGDPAATHAAPLWRPLSHQG